MRWPGKVLEARLRASLRRLFRRRKRRSQRLGLPMMSRPCSGENCPNYHAISPYSRWTDNDVSLGYRQSFKDTSPVRPYSSGIYGIQTQGIVSPTYSPFLNEICTKKLSKSDASVNTDVSSVYQVHDAFSQVEPGEPDKILNNAYTDNAMYLHEPRHYRSNMPTSSTDSKAQNEFQPRREMQKHMSATFNPKASEIQNDIMLVEPYYTDPSPVEGTEISKRSTSTPKRKQFYAGDSYLRMNVPTPDCLRLPACSPNINTRSSYEMDLAQRPSTDDMAPKFISFEPQINVGNSRKHCNLSQCSFAGNNWIKLFHDESVQLKEESHSTTSGQLQLISDLLVSPVQDRSKSAYESVKAEQQAAGSGQEHSNKLRSSAIKPRASAVSTDRSSVGFHVLDEWDPGTDSLEDQNACSSRSGRQSLSSQRRPGLSRSCSFAKKAPESCTSYPSTARRPADTASHRLSETQMIYHNCSMINKELPTRRSEKSDRSLPKSTLFPHSASDDGDASKLRFERSADRSSISSIHNRRFAATKSITMASSKRSFSRSPSQIKKPQKQRGALPASNDHNECPTGRHSDIKPDKPCICLLVKRMVIAQSKPVLYSWHLPLKKPVTNPRLSRSTSGKPTGFSAEAEHRGETPSISAGKTLVPSLPNFQLARPTRMVRGGQGTVAWVTNVSTGQFYALKFKQREGRSDSTWAIERREAKLLRHARHDFIVRLFHIYETEDTLFMALEWLDGGCLWNHIARTGTLPECYATYYAACILCALRYLHSISIVYRDMKAENVVLDQRGRPKLIDFGMAKRFRSSTEVDQNHDSLEEGSNDSEDFDQPPTRYYFAAYLAPEIYDHSQSTCHFIDSWGLGYILVEMLLGYGIFLPMPWEKEPGQHLSVDWKLNLPNDSNSRLSHICGDFVHRMLLRLPEERMTLEQAEKHAFFARVSWSRLGTIRGPDLSKCPARNATTTQPTGPGGGGRRWLTKSDNITHVPDMAFVREFFGTASNQNVIYTTHAFGLGARRSKVVKPIHTKPNDVTFNESRSLNYGATDRYRAVNSTSRPQTSLIENAIEIRGSQPGPREVKKEINKVVRNPRRQGISAN
ncbi:kinase domain protein [Opisthorchis viverrini]|uniref:non-specific serine/threonine protein kinase n=1 Tax=Opisthorchis viverrini TaxID=6198 RepID=A0A1S8X8R9_OPIVI|nr:kinase domain protein [Opisthorchis viverrini]